MEIHPYNFLKFIKSEHPEMLEKFYKRVPKIGTKVTTLTHINYKNRLGEVLEVVDVDIEKGTVELYNGKDQHYLYRLDKFNNDFTIID